MEFDSSSLFLRSVRHSTISKAKSSTGVSVLEEWSKGSDKDTLDCHKYRSYVYYTAPLVFSYSIIDSPFHMTDHARFT